MPRKKKENPNLILCAFCDRNLKKKEIPFEYELGKKGYLCSKCQEDLDSTIFEHKEPVNVK